MLRTLAKEWGKLLHERLGKLHGKGLGKLQGGLKTLEGECGNAEKGCVEGQVLTRPLGKVGGK